MGKSKAKKIALCGVMSAVCIVIMFLASIIGVGIYAGPLLASFALIPITAEYGTKTSLLSYAAVSMISVLVMPDRELAFFFVCFGWYQAVYPKLSKIKSKLLQKVIKLLIYSIIIFVMYGIIIRIIGIDPGFAEELWIVNALMFVVGAATFIILDKVYAKIVIKWNTDWRSKLMR